MRYNFIPGFIKRIIYRIFKKLLLIRDNALNNNDMPSLELEKIHVKNTKVLINRKELLENLPNHSICAEIGVNKGNFSEQILEYCKPKKLHLIDAWSSERYNNSVEKIVKQKFSGEIENNLVYINKGFSTEVLKSFNDHYFDWVYLDTSHTYKTTIDELNIIHKKLKKGGIIAGHDYVTRSRTDAMKYGVIEAVHQFCIEKKYELLFISLE